MRNVVINNAIRTTRNIYISFIQLHSAVVCPCNSITTHDTFSSEALIGSTAEAGKQTPLTGVKEISNHCKSETPIRFPPQSLSFTALEN